MLISHVRNARTLDHPLGCDLQVVDGVIAGVTAPRAAPAATDELDAGGRVVLPATVDAHVHLDKAYLLDEEGDGADGPAGALGADGSAGALGPAGDLAFAIRHVAALRSSVPLAVTRARAVRAAGALVRHGTTAARAHVELDEAVGLDLIEVHRAVAAEVPGLRLQLTAFPQRGLASTAMVRLLNDAMHAGLDVVGGCPYVDSDARAHLDVVFSLAERHGAPVDLHLDFSDDVTTSLIPQVAEYTRASGMQGRVTIGHVTTLAAMPLDDQARSFDTLAEADIALVVLPATDLFLVGHGEPGTRSMAPYERALAAGVRTAIGNNNIANPFSPFGNANLLQAAWLAGLLRRASSPADRAQLLSAVTSNPAAVLGLPAHGTRVGEVADLIVLDWHDVATAVLQAPPAVATVSGGRVTSAVPAPSPVAPVTVAAATGASSARG